jgi:hypothetical protein
MGLVSLAREWRRNEGEGAGTAQREEQDSGLEMIKSKYRSEYNAYNNLIFGNIYLPTSVNCIQLFFGSNFLLCF